MTSTLLPIAKSGIKYMLYSFAIFTALSIFHFYTLALAAFFFIVIFAYIYRNPEREQSIFEKNSVLSPVDGLVISIEEIKDADYVYKVEVDNTYLDVAILRAPFDCVLSAVNAHHGARLSLGSSLGKKINENIELVFTNGEYQTMKIKHVLKQSVVPFSVYAKKGQKLKQACRYGDMPNGITEMYIPRNFRLNMNEGDRLTASQTLIGYFISVP